MTEGNLPTSLDEEFLPLPYFGWDERPPSVPLDADECATAIHIAHGELERASALLKVPLHRLTRFVRHSPRLQRVLDESLQHVLIRAASVAIDTLFDPGADARRREWASSKVLSSRLARGHPLSPASDDGPTVTVNQAREIIFRWKAPGNDTQTIDSSYEVSNDAANE
jgi:hypothetical protein